MSMKTQWYLKRSWRPRKSSRVSEKRILKAIEEQFVSIVQVYGQTQTKLMYDKILKTRPLP